jgi:hypothetical protein
MMEKGWIASTVADMRRAPDVQSERISQLLIFSPIEILEENQDWIYVHGPDGYKGWVKKGCVKIGTPTAPKWKVATPWAQVREISHGKPLGILPLDTAFDGEKRWRKIVFLWPTGERAYVEAKAVIPVNQCGGIPDLLALAQSLVGIPYLWGGTTTFGFDCSGFIQRLFHFTFNIWLPRDSQEQASVGQKVPHFEDLRAGDILCFPDHVALYLGEGKMIHASGRYAQVVISKPDDPYSVDLKSKFLFGVRVEPPPIRTHLRS